MVKKTNREIVTFLNIGRNWLQEHGKVDSKFRYALNKLCKRFTKLEERLNDQLGDNAIEHCSVDEKTKVLLRDANGQLQFTKEGIRARNLANKDLMETEVEIESHYVTEISETVSIDDKEVFEGFVIPGPAVSDQIES